RENAVDDLGDDAVAVADDAREEGFVIPEFFDEVTTEFVLDATRLVAGFFELVNGGGRGMRHRGGSPEFVRGNDRAGIFGCLRFWGRIFLTRRARRSLRRIAVTKIHCSLFLGHGLVARATIGGADCSR